LLRLEQGGQPIEDRAKPVEIDPVIEGRVVGEVVLVKRRAADAVRA
jgi:hypothetical protein